MALLDFLSQIGSGINNLQVSPGAQGLMGALASYNQVNPPLPASRLPLPKPTLANYLAGAAGGFGQGYGQGLQNQSQQTQNALNQMTLAGYQRMQQQNAGGVPNTLGGAVAPQMGGATGGQLPGDLANDASVPTQQLLRQTPMGAPPSPAPPNPGPGAPMPGAPPSGGGGAQPAPLFNMPSIAQQYKIAAATPGMQQVAAGLLGLIQKGTPEGAYVDVNGGVQSRPGFQSFIEQSAASKAAGAAPYDIAKELAGQAGRAVEVSPGSAAFTGLDRMDPQAKQILLNMLSRGGLIPGQGGGGAPGPGAAMPGPQMAAGGGPSDATGFPTQPTRLPGGGLQTPLTLEGATMQKTVLPENFKKASDNYAAAQGQNFNLDMIDHAMESLNQSGLYSTGTGANAKIAAFKALNSVTNSLGFGDRFDAMKIANWQDLNKESTRMGFELAKTLGSREAQMIVQQAVSAVPNAENTYMGARLVSSSLRQAAQRNIDYYEFLNNYAMQHGGTTLNADVTFNKLHPVSDYTNKAILTAVPPAAVQALRADPSKAGEFDNYYGKQGLAKMVLGLGP